MQLEKTHCNKKEKKETWQRRHIIQGVRNKTGTVGLAKRCRKCNNEEIKKKVKEKSTA